MSAPAQSSTMSLPLSLRPPPARSEEPESLKDLIHRIHAERGHFRNVTEQGLEEEIAAQQSTETQKQNDAGHEGEDRPQTIDERRKELYAAKEEMLRFAGQANNEVLTALDFISLLMSKDAPRQGELTMSPALKQQVRPASLDFDKLQSVKSNKSQEAYETEVSKGWTLQSIESSADALLQSAGRLGKEIKKETRFWSEVLSVSERGWSVCRMPRESHTIGVRYGFSEASSSFYARGLAAMRPDADGNITLDEDLSRAPKRIRVQVRERGRVTETSRLNVAVDAAQAPTETLIRQARDSLFDEELFYEAQREARTLLSYGVKVRNNRIHIPDTNQTTRASKEPPFREIVIDQVTVAEDDAAVDSHEDDAAPRADAIALALRLSQTQAYRKRFSRRTRRPPPISDEKRTPPHEEIIRPLMNHLRHVSSVSNVSSALQTSVQTLVAARVPASCSHAVSSPLPSDLLSQASSASASATKHSTARLPSNIATQLSGPLSTTATFSLSPAGPPSFSIKTTTHHSPPLHGTTYTFTPEPRSSASSRPKTSAHAAHAQTRDDEYADEQTFSSLAALTAHVVAHLQISLTKYLSAAHPQWTLELSNPDRDGDGDGDDNSPEQGQGSIAALVSAAANEAGASPRATSNVNANGAVSGALLFDAVASLKRGGRRAAVVLRDRGARMVLFATAEGTATGASEEGEGQDEGQGEFGVERQDSRDADARTRHASARSGMRVVQAWQAPSSSLASATAGAVAAPAEEDERGSKQGLGDILDAMAQG